MQIGFNAEAMCDFHDAFYCNIFFPFSQKKDGASKKKQDRRNCDCWVCAGLFAFEGGGGGGDGVGGVVPVDRKFTPTKFASFGPLLEPW